MASNDHHQVNIKDDIKVITVADPAALAKAAAERIVARIAANRGRVAICLAGGSSPKQLYQLLATEAYRSQIPWDRVHWFVGDERFVPAADPLSNMAMARGVFLDRCAPAANIHPLPIDSADPQEAARRYERELRSFYGANELDLARPLFDVMLLGVGPDGHTASLFPGYPAVEETERWVIEVPKAHVEPFVPRVTLTLPALGSCREMLIEASGAGKRPILTRVFAGEDLPANRVHSAGETIWLVDAAALPENFRER
jgi:6-phosphogluconolactonase